MAQSMADDDNPKLVLKYSMTFTVLAPAAILLYILGAGWLILVITFLIIALILLYTFKIHPWITAHTDEETNELYPKLLAATMDRTYRFVSRKKTESLSADQEDRFRKQLENMGLSDETINATMDHLRERYRNRPNSEGENRA